MSANSPKKAFTLRIVRPVHRAIAGAVLAMSATTMQAYADDTNLSTHIFNNDADAVRSYLATHPETNVLVEADYFGNSHLGYAMELKHKRIAIILAQHNNMQKGKARLARMESEMTSLNTQMQAYIEATERHKEDESVVVLLEQAKITTQTRIDELETLIAEQAASLQDIANADNVSVQAEPSTLTVIPVESDVDRSTIARIELLEEQVDTLLERFKANDEVAERIMERFIKDQQSVIRYEQPKE